MAGQEKKCSVKTVLDKEEFDNQLQNAGDKLVVIDFYADWCGPCKMIAPKIEEMAEKLKDLVVFLKVNVDESDEIAAEQGIQAMPTFVFFQNGKKLNDFVGANFAKLEQEIEEKIQGQVKR